MEQANNTNKHRIKQLEIGKYKVTMKIDDVLCTCMWGTLHSENWREGKKICKHITQAVKELKCQQEYTKEQKNTKKI